MTAPGWEQWLLWPAPLLAATAIGTHLAMSASQTLLHRWMGHRRWGGRFFRNHIDFHHRLYAPGHLTSAVYRGEDGNNTPYFLIPTLLAAGGLFFVMPLWMFLAMAMAATASFATHVYFDKAYHVAGSPLERFAWFRRKQRLHFVHHMHANSNFAVIDFFWDRLFGTYRAPDDEPR
ncbi:MAG: sterol desaturase family protein [Rhodospirillales bacterium]|nr:sterol desaturase family protein [Rhodospirillales bacterium]